MKQLLPFLKNYKIQSVLAPLFKMLEAVFELIVPLVVASIINDGIREGNLKLVVSKALLLVLLAVVGMSAAITAQFLRQRLPQASQRKSDIRCLKKYSPSLLMRLTV